MFKAALQRAIQEWIVPVERLRAAETGDLEQTLLAIGEVLLANIMSPAGLRLLRLTNAESGRSPDVGATNVQQGTEPTIQYLAEMFMRRLGGGVPLPLAGGARGGHVKPGSPTSPPPTPPASGRGVGGLTPQEAREAAEGFLHLVTGPAIDAAWGVQRDEAALARHIKASVRLFLHGVLGGNGGADAGALEAENRRLKEKLARVSEVLGEAG